MFTRFNTLKFKFHSKRFAYNSGSEGIKAEPTAEETKKYDAKKAATADINSMVDVFKIKLKENTNNPTQTETIIKKMIDEKTQQFADKTPEDKKILLETAEVAKKSIEQIVENFNNASEVNREKSSLEAKLAVSQNELKNFETPEQLNKVVADLVLYRESLQKLISKIDDPKNKKWVDEFLAKEIQTQLNQMSDTIEDMNRKAVDKQAETEKNLAEIVAKYEQIKKLTPKGYSIHFDDLKTLAEAHHSLAELVKSMGKFKSPLLEKANTSLTEIAKYNADSIQGYANMSEGFQKIYREYVDANNIVVRMQEVVDHPEKYKQDPKAAKERVAGAEIDLERKKRVLQDAVGSLSINPLIAKSPAIARGPSEKLVPMKY